MGDKHILIANPDLRTLGDHGRALGQQWKVTLVTNSAEAIASLTTQPCDVLVADAELPDANGMELLERVHEEYPKTIRILLASEGDEKVKMAELHGTHLVLPKPCEAPTLKNAVERVLAINLWLASDSLRELVGRLRTFPIVPSLYLEVVKALKSPHTTTVEIGEIIAKDMAMMTKLLRVTNSACFGLPRKISDPVEAVGILGFETVKTMVMTLKLLSQYDKVKPVYFSIDRLWRHSTEVARLARLVVRAQSDDPILAESAFAAGLMHDIGKLILAANFDAQYSSAQETARNEQIPLAEVEKRVFGATHGEIGAYLLGLWGMPLDLVEAAALHHEPSRSLAKSLNPLTAVHVANALSYEMSPDNEGFVPTKIDEAYLAELGLTDRLKFWRESILTPETGATEFRSRSSQTSVFRKAPSAPKAPLRLAEPLPEAGAPASGWFSASKHWLYAGAAAVVLLLFFWFGMQALISPALGPSQEEAKAAAPSIEAAPIAVKQTPPPAAAEAPVSIAAKPAEKPAPGARRGGSYQSPPVPQPSAIDVALGELRLESIFFSPSHPSAVISGRAVRPNDRLADGAMVVTIGPSSVVLQFDQERRTLSLQ